MNNKKVLQKKNTIIMIGLVFFTCMFVLDSCRPRAPRAPRIPPTMVIKINKEKNDGDIYTSDNLRELVTRYKGQPSVVVRNRFSGGGSSVSENASSSYYTQLIERGLMKKGWNVRDRQLFENVMSKAGDEIDYVMLQEKTKTDLLFEITEVTTDVTYTVKEYYKDGVPTKFPPKRILLNPEEKNPKKQQYESIPTTYTFNGFSIEIKVIILKENEMGGIYRFFYTPCSDEGCKIAKIAPLSYYYDNSDNVRSAADTNEGSSRNVSRSEKNDAQWREFIETVVIPTMDAEIRKEK